MPLSADHAANTSADAFDVQLRYFAAGVNFTALTDLATFNVHYDSNLFYDAGPTGWTISGETITPTAPWTEVTSLIAHEGSWTQEWVGATQRWAAQVRGYDYDATYFGPEKALCCLWRLTRGAYDSGWVLFWLGVVDTGGYSDDYRHGAAWQRTIRSVEATLDLTDAPRITVGTLNLALDASVTASSTLATPEAEAPNGEFIGATADVSPDKLIDGRLNSVWISQDPPTASGETVADPPPAWPVFDEVFNWPLAGYNRATTWWFELANGGGTVDFARDDFYIITRNTAGEYAVLSFKYPGGEAAASTYTLASGERCVICADKRAFDAYTGGAAAAKFVLEAKSWGTLQYKADGDLAYEQGDGSYRLFDLHPTDGFLICHHNLGGGTWDAVVWGNPALPARLPGSHWVDSAGAPTTVGVANDIPDGASIRRQPSLTDTQQASDWQVELYPRPGDKWTPNTPQWIQLVLARHTATLDVAVAAGAATLVLGEGTTGWPSAGAGICEGDTFSYTGTADGALTGVSGLASAHARGAALWPTENGEMMTGWQVASIQFRRRSGLSKIEHGRLYLAKNDDCRTPDSSDPTDDAWQSDYEAPIVGQTSPRGSASKNGTITFNLGNRASLWTRTILLVIDAMDDDGRAKLNEIEVNLAAASVDNSGLADLSTATAAAVAGHLIGSHSWLGAGQFGDNTPAGWGRIGRLTLAIAPLPTVLDDLARMHGCLLRYTPSGRVGLDADPWWPGGRTHTEPTYTFTDSSLRRQIKVSDGRPQVTGVAVTATGTDGQALERAVAPAGATGSGVREETGYTVADQAAALDLAQALYAKAQNAKTLTLTVKGSGEWCRVRDVYQVIWNSRNIGQWIAEKVVYSWGRNKWTCDVSCRSFF